MYFLVALITSVATANLIVAECANCFKSGTVFLTALNFVLMASVCLIALVSLADSCCKCWVDKAFTRHCHKTLAD